MSRRTLRQLMLTASLTLAASASFSVASPGVGHADVPDTWAITVTPIAGPELGNPTFNVDIRDGEQRIYAFVVTFRDQTMSTKDQVIQWVKDYDPTHPTSGQTCINWVAYFCVPDPDLG